MGELKFKVSSGLKSILGQDLITSDNIAILELVKNSYDAHATKVTITFEDDSIVISDNGKGMTLNDLKEKWLFVGYSAKRDGTEDASYRSYIHRNYAGAKGIGRISCDRLGSNLCLTTKSEASSSVERLFVDWSEFEKSFKTEFENIEVTHESLSENYSFAGGSEFGTELKITGLRSGSLWTSEKILDIRRSLEKMVNPFSGADSFSIAINASSYIEDDKKILAKIEKGREKISEQKIAKLKSQIINGEIKNTISEVLAIKTTAIESCLHDGIITTRLLDRGELMYEIQEKNKFEKLSDVSINLLYLNQSAKRLFSNRMGVTPVNYGNVMLFRNGFRVWPYGERGDDSWKIDRRAGQSRNNLGTRNLLGRVDVVTTDVDAFKEVSSRDGGLVMNESSSQLNEYFTIIHRRLERYVAGVLWGTDYVKKAYFSNKEIAKEVKERLLMNEKNSDTSENLFENIGSRVDFLQLVNSLVDDTNIEVLSFNKRLANVVSDDSYATDLNDHVFETLRDLADKTNDKTLLDDLLFYEQRLEILRSQNKKTEEKLKEAELKAEFYKKMSTPDTDALIHHVKNNSSRIEDAAQDLLSFLKRREQIDYNELSHALLYIVFLSKKAIEAADLVLKCDLAKADAQVINLPSFIQGYLTMNNNKVNCHFETSTDVFEVYGSKLELGLMLDNFIKNSEEWNATNIWMKCSEEENFFYLDIYDDGDGLSEKFKDNPDVIFNFAVSGKVDGSGLGLYLIKECLNSFNSSISIEAPINNTGIHFKIIFK